MTRFDTPPMAPYEMPHPRDTTGRQLFRPLVYAFTHHTLPVALFTHHPELMQALRQPEPDGEALLHMWSQAKVVCEQQGFLPPDNLDDIDTLLAQAAKFWEYLGPLMRAVQLTRHDTARHQVWVLTMPAPKAPTEAYWIALCRPVDEADDYQPQGGPTRSRYFTLEATEQATHGFLCEWTRELSHANHGAMPLPDREGFVLAVHQQLAR